MIPFASWLLPLCAIFRTPMAATYYVSDCLTGADADCQAGDDAATGLSPQTPWRTFGKAMQSFGSLSAGAFLDFRAGEFRETVILPGR